MWSSTGCLAKEIVYTSSLWGGPSQCVGPMGGSPKKLFTLLDLCVSSLRRGHANLLCIVPILTDDPRRKSGCQCLASFLHCVEFRICSTPIALVPFANSAPNDDLSFCNSLLASIWACEICFMAAGRHLRAWTLRKPFCGLTFDVGGLPLLPFGAMAEKCQ